MARSGLVVNQAFVFNGHEQLDVSEEVREGRRLTEEESFFVSLRQIEDAAAKELSVEVEQDPVSFDAAKLLVASAIKEGRPVPAPLRAWAYGLITGETVRPVAKGKLLGATDARDRMICMLVQELLDAFSLKPTSGEREAGTSACNAVAKAFALVGLAPSSYEAVIGIWGKRKKHMQFDSRAD
ncbi:hypothetical protein L0V05_01760 [Tabrizicola sp. J26]|nr:hypothetical protein [Tabrizicola rongguiensis]